MKLGMITSDSYSLFSKKRIFHEKVTTHNGVDRLFDESFWN